MTTSTSVDRLIEIRTPYGRPVDWAEVAMVSDVGDSHELNDDRCLIISSRDLGAPARGPLGDFLLCLLADGATGSTFAPEIAPGDADLGPVQAGWRASQLAQAAFVEKFLSSQEVDVMDRLREGLRAADRALLETQEGALSTTLTALFLGANGTACAASIGDSVLLVLPPSRKSPGDRRLKKLGYEDTTAVGSGDTTLSYVDESELIEQWWPHKEDGRAQTSVEPGTFFVLASDGISDNLPAEVIDQLLHRHSLDGATVGLARHTRERRAQTQRRGGGSTTQLGLDNMSAIVVRFDGRPHRSRASAPRLDDARLLAVLGTHGGPAPDSGGHFGAVCLASYESAEAVVPTLLRALFESEHAAEPSERLSRAFVVATSASAPSPENTVRLSAVALDASGNSHAFSSGSAALDSLLDVRVAPRSVLAARDSPLQTFIYSPRLWASSLAALALFVLVSTAFATGTVRPAPPPAPTVRPGEPTPTPDTRPVISIGGVQLMAPLAQATPAPVVVSYSDSQAANTDTDSSASDDAAAEAPGPPEPSPPASGCSNWFGLLCGNTPHPRPAAPPSRNAPRQGNRELPVEPVVPVASPVPGADDADRALGLRPPGPPAGSNLDDALRVASIADQRFQRGLSAPTPLPSQEKP